MQLDRSPNRRQFCSYGASAVAAIAAGGKCLLALAANAPANPYPPGRFFDIHTHIGQIWNTGEELTVDGLLKWMDANDVAQAAVLPVVSPEASTYPTTTKQVLDDTKPHRDRLIPFCCIDPRTSYSGGQKGLLGILQRWIDAGAKGFGEHKPGVKIDDPRSMAIYAACGELKLPVLFHLDVQRNMDLPGLPGLECALREHPETKFIGHGPGWWASISGDATAKDLGDYPEGPVKPGGAIDVLMAKYPNLYGDLSANSGAGALKRDLEFSHALVLRHIDRLMFGTDYLAPKQVVPQFDVVRALKLPPEAEAKLYRDNARRLLFGA